LGLSWDKRGQNGENGKVEDCTKWFGKKGNKIYSIIRKELGKERNTGEWGKRRVKAYQGLDGSETRKLR